MAYQIEMISELDGRALATGAEIVDKYISTKNCTGLLVGVQCLQNGSTLPVIADDFNSKMGTIEVVATSRDGGSSMVSIDVDDIPPLMEKIYGKPVSTIKGVTSQVNNDFFHYEYFLPLSPDPWSPKFGFRDARVKFLTAADPSTSDTYKLYVAALLHDEMPENYIQMMNNSFTATSGTNKDLDLPEGGTLMGTYAFGTTSINDLTTADSPTIDQMALVIDNSEMQRINARVMDAYYPSGTYYVGTTATMNNTDYLFWDLGFRRGYGINIGRNWKLRIKPLASNAVRAYPLIAMRAAR